MGESTGKNTKEALQPARAGQLFGMTVPSLPRWAWSLVGGAIGLFDFGVLLALDANMTIAGSDATVLFGVGFFVPYALLGWAVGGLAHAHERAVRDRETIEGQLVALECAQRALVQEEKLAGIGRLAAGVAHEVRNPLGVIRASASMAQESFDPGTDPHRALSFVCEETDRLDRLVGSLLTFARPQPIECVPTEIGKVFDRVLDLARHDAEAAGITLEVDAAANLPLLIADPDRLSGALYGLALNAIQAIRTLEPSPDAKPQAVRLSASREDDHARIVVNDSGPGIPETLHEQIFEPFVTTRDDGTGLGLPMALRLIEAQGGSLALDDRAVTPDDLPGARFIVALPMTKAEGEGEGEADLEAEPAPPTHVQADPGRRAR